MSEALRDILAELAAIERKRAKVGAAIAAARSEALKRWHRENRACITEFGRLDDAVTTLRQEASREALALYEATGDTEPAPGISIQTETVLEYDDADAIIWLLGLARALGYDPSDYLSIRRRRAEKIMRAQKPVFVQFREEPQVTFARDLADLYKEAAGEGVTEV